MRSLPTVKSRCMNSTRRTDAAKKLQPRPLKSARRGLRLASSANHVSGRGPLPP